MVCDCLNQRSIPAVLSRSSAQPGWFSCLPSPCWTKWNAVKGSNLASHLRTMGFSQLGFYPRQSKSFYAGSLKKHPKGIGVFYYNTSSPKYGGGVFNNFFLLGITWTVFFFQGVMEFPVGEMFHCVVRDDNNSGVTHTWNSKQPFF